MEYYVIFGDIQDNGQKSVQTEKTEKNKNKFFLFCLIDDKFCFFSLEMKLETNSSLMACICDDDFLQKQIQT